MPWWGSIVGQLDSMRGYSEGTRTVRHLHSVLWGTHMKPETRAKLTIALMLVSVVGTAVGVNALALQQARRAGIQTQDVAVASAAPVRAVAPTQAAPTSRIVVASAYSGSVEFADKSDIDAELRVVSKELRRIERAMSKDLASGSLRARNTRIAIRTTRALAGGSTAERLAATQGAFLALERAMRADMVNGDLSAPHARGVVAEPRGVTEGTNLASLAGGVVATTEDLWRLELAFEKDIHAGDVVARETHFAIDRRRW